MACTEVHCRSCTKLDTSDCTTLRQFAQSCNMTQVQMLLEDCFWRQETERNFDEREHFTCQALCLYSASECLRSRPSLRSRIWLSCSCAPKSKDGQEAWRRPFCISVRSFSFQPETLRPGGLRQSSRRPSRHGEGSYGSSRTGLRESKRTRSLTRACVCFFCLEIRMGALQGR